MNLTSGHVQGSMAPTKSASPIGFYTWFTADLFIYDMFGYEVFPMSVG